MCPFLGLVTRTSDIPDSEAASDVVPGDSPAVKDGVILALSQPFIFLGLTICGLVGAVLLLVYLVYRIVKHRQMKRGALPSRRQCSPQNPPHANALRNVEGVADIRSGASVTLKLPSLFDRESAPDLNESVRSQAKFSEGVTGAFTQRSQGIHNEHELHRDRSLSLAGNNCRPLTTIRLVNAGTNVDAFPHHLPFQRLENDSAHLPLVVYNKKPSQKSHSFGRQPPGEFPFSSHSPGVGLSNRNSQLPFPENRIRRSRATFHLVKAVKAEGGCACISPHLETQTDEAYTSANVVSKF